jgi:NAD kinase
MESPYTGERTSKLALNEIFIAEQDVGKTSTYKLIADGVDLGKFKSSGVILSTGTGSTGWLFSARRIT